MRHGPLLVMPQAIADRMKKPGKKVWKISKGAFLPKELKIVKDMRQGHEGHYMIAPAIKMTLKKYLEALEELGLDRSRIKLVTNMELANAG